MIVTAKILDNVRKVNIQEVGVIVKGNPIKVIKAVVKNKENNTNTIREIKSNCNIENGFVRLYNSFKYQTGDLWNTYTLNKGNSYVYSFKIDDDFGKDEVNPNDSSDVEVPRPFYPVRFDYHYTYDTTYTYNDKNYKLFKLYPCCEDNNSHPDAGEWPSPVFIRTAQITKNGNLLVIGTKGLTIKFYTNSGYSGDPVYTTEALGNITPVYNLLPQTLYYYQVLDSQNNVILSGNFTTEGQIRFIRLPLVHNVRDCGGYKTIDGSRTFKYGLIFRGSQFEKWSDSNPRCTPTEQSLAKVVLELHGNLKVSKAIDLRKETYPALVLNAFDNKIDRVALVENNSAPSYSSIYDNSALYFKFLQETINSIKVGNSVYVHCQQGRDRTGSHIAILLALCNISEDGILKDYELTTAWGVMTSRYNMNCWETSVGSSETLMWNKFLPDSSTTIQSKVQLWFITNYNVLQDNTYRILDDLGQIITSGELALTYIQNIFMTSIEQVEHTFTLAHTNYMSTNMLNNSDVIATATASNVSGKTVTVNSNTLTLSPLVSPSETFIGYSDLQGNLLSNTINLDNNPIVFPKTKGNLMYVKDIGYEWSDYLVSSINRYRLYKKANSSFCASAIIWTTANNPLKFTIASLANLTIKFRSINPVLAGGTFEASHNRDDIYKMVTLTLDSNGSATYTPLNTGMVVFNFAIKDVEGYTKFTTALLDEIQINYAKVSAWSIPSVSVETILYVGGINQSIVYYNNYVIAFRDHIQTIIIIDTLTKSIVKTITPNSSVATSTVHCNAATLMPIKYNEADLFPMIMVSGDSGTARILRLVGSSVTSLTAAKVCDWLFTYYTTDWGGMAVTLGSNLYYLKWSTLLYKINIDITNISNYVDRTIDVTSQASVVSLKITKTGLDIEVIPTSKGNLFISEYGPEPDYWNAYIYSSDRYYLNGITISNLNDGGNIVGFVPFYRVRFNLGEPDGIAYAGNNTFYLMINTEGKASLYKLTMTLPEF